MALDPMTKAAMPGFGREPPTDGQDDFGFANGTGRFAALNLPAARVPPILTSVVGETGITREQEYGRMLKTLVSNVPGMVYRCRNDADWTMEFVSDGFERLTGYRVSDILRNHRIRFEDIIHPDDRGLMREAMADVAGEGEPFDVEYRIIHADSTLRWVWERGIGVCDGSPQPIAYEGLIQDITARKLAEQAVVEAERRYRGIFDNAIEGIFRTSADGHFIEANPALAQICGFDSVDELVKSYRDIGAQIYVDPERRAKFMHLISVRGSVSGFESQIFRKNGDVIWVSENARAVVDDKGDVQAYEGMLADITERKLYQARIEQQANYDTLTGLANRSLLQDRLQQSMLACAAYGSRLAVAFIDLDRFKFINDSLGHHIGDELLKCIAKRLSSCVREIDTVARLGGDEFVLLISEQAANPDSLRKVMERVLAVVAEPWVIEQGEFNVTASVGVARYPDDGSDAPTLLKHADSAMYRAKDRGRNRVQFFTNDLNLQMIENLEMESKLRRALEREQFLLHYQPRVDLNSGACLGAEALIRWQVSPQEIISPHRFIPLAEETGIIVPIGRWVLETACTQNKEWQDMGLDPMVVSVNVSARQFRQDDFVQTVVAVLKKTGLEARYLEIELTESMVMHDAERLVAMLDELKRIGVHMSVDDFGTGYSSLSYLKRFPVDRLKIDRSFVQDLTSDTNDATIVRTIIALGHNLGLRVVAEGVETAEQSDFLRQNDCDEAQGYFFGRPVPNVDFIAWLNQQRRK
jgi:diguanylate cyclase (GGDEF)-like protein/PAS domain S-box-containing protein